MIFLNESWTEREERLKRERLWRFIGWIVYTALCMGVGVAFGWLLKH
jgi:hypothetical protein